MRKEMRDSGNSKWIIIDRVRNNKGNRGDKNENIKELYKRI